MTEEEMLFIATKYWGKGYSCEDMCYGDDIYHLKGDEAAEVKDKIRDYMAEIDEIGRKAFYSKYKNFKLY